MSGAAVIFVFALAIFAGYSEAVAVVVIIALAGLKCVEWSVARHRRRNRKAPTKSSTTDLTARGAITRDRSIAVRHAATTDLVYSPEPSPSNAAEAEPAQVQLNNTDDEESCLRQILNAVWRQLVEKLSRTDSDTALDRLSGLHAWAIVAVTDGGQEEAAVMATSGHLFHFDISGNVFVVRFTDSGVQVRGLSRMNGAFQCLGLIEPTLYRHMQ